MTDSIQTEQIRFDSKSEFLRTKEMKHHLQMAKYDSLKFMNEAFFTVLMIGVSAYLASFNRSSSQTLSAYINVSAVQMSLFCDLCFGTVAWVQGFFSINSHFTACSKQFLSSLLISLTVLEDTNSFRLVLFNGLITARLFKRL